MRYKWFLWLGVIVALLLGCGTCSQQARRAVVSGFSVEVPLGKSTSIWITSDGCWLVKDEGVVVKSPSATVRRYTIQILP